MVWEYESKSLLLEYKDMGELGSEVGALKRKEIIQ